MSVNLKTVLRNEIKANNGNISKVTKTFGYPTNFLYANGKMPETFFKNASYYFGMPAEKIHAYIMLQRQGKTNNILYRRKSKSQNTFHNASKTNSKKVNELTKELLHSRKIGNAQYKELARQIKNVSENSQKKISPNKLASFITNVIKSNLPKAHFYTPYKTSKVQKTPRSKKQIFNISLAEAFHDLKDGKPAKDGKAILNIAKYISSEYGINVDNLMNNYHLAFGYKLKDRLPLPNANNLRVLNVYSDDITTTLDGVSHFDLTPNINQIATFLVDASRSVRKVSQDNMKIRKEINKKYLTLK